MEELMIRVLAGEASFGETRRLSSWIRQSRENEEAFIAFKKVFQLSTEHLRAEKDMLPEIDLDQEWLKFRDAVDGGRQAYLPVAEAKNSMNWLKMAAAVLILLVSGLVINYLLYRNDVLYETAGNTLSIELPDGSTVVLNRRSALLYKPSFGEENRTVELDGEGYFAVRPDPSKPFIIETSKGVVRVLGTSFTVLSYDSLQNVEVVVESGVVKFAVPEAKSEMELTAGQKAVYHKDSKVLTTGLNDDVNFLSWKTGKMIFTNTPLLKVIETLNKTYHANITLSSAAAETCVVTVTFDGQSLEAVLKVLENTLNLTTTRNGNLIIINGEGC